MDQADLDFGIYRIMNLKRKEVASFIERDLLPQVTEALEASKGGRRGNRKGASSRAAADGTEGPPITSH